MYAAFPGPGPEPIGFLLIPQFSSLAFFCAVEPLRVANRLAGRPLFSWQLFSETGEPVEASNGLRMIVDGKLSEAAGLPTLILCAGFDPAAAETKRLLAALRRLDRLGVTLGGLDTGPHILARAGLLDDVPVTMHWEAVPGFREDFPGIEVSGELFEVRPRRFTCAGGTAALDLMLDMIGRKHGMPLAVAVSEQFIHDRIRSSHDHQRMAPATRLSTTNRKLLKVVALMEAHLDEPLGRDALAEAAGVTIRQMERLFRGTLGASPGDFYRGLRLDRARQLLQQTDLGVLQVALATGFGSASSLSRSYRQRFGTPPRRDRRPAL